MVIEFVNLVINRLPELWLRITEHLFLTGVSTVIAIFVGIPLGILATRPTTSAWLRGLLISAINMVQTIPSLAMLAILLVILGKIGTLPAIIALILYALLPIVRNTIAGLENVPGEITEAARGIGMTERQELWMVRIPLSIKVIITGIRTAAVTGVGIATLSAFIGAGGLGQFINRGIALSNTNLILLGAIPTALLALIIDYSIGALEKGLQFSFSEWNFKKYILMPITIALPVLLVLTGGIALFSEFFISNSTKGSINAKTGIIRIGSKNFTEQLILGELIAKLIESKTNLSVERHFNLGGTIICHNALLKSEIDIYPEYTGTALTTILNLKAIKNPDKTLQVVRQYYRDRFNIEWLSPFGFNNSYAITVRKTDANLYGLRNISDLGNISAKFHAGFTSEFAERPDGYPGLRKSYGLTFKKVNDIDPSMMYEAIKKKEIDVISAFATDGRIKAYNLAVLKDDLTFFPPYYAAALIRIEILQAYPELRKALALLTGLIDNNMMQQLNYEVDEKKQSPEKVAHEFLILNNLTN